MKALNNRIFQKSKEAVANVLPSKKKLTKFMAGLFMVGLNLQQLPSSASIANLEFNNNHQNHVIEEVDEIDATEYFQMMKTEFSQQDRDDFARLLYGEAGIGADAFEIIHTVLNRMSSPLFKGTAHDIITKPGEYEGYRPENPVTPKFRFMVNFAIARWQKNGCKPIEHCNHYYFVTGVPCVNNKFEVSPEDSQGAWVPKDEKVYEKPGHYCQHAHKDYREFKECYRVHQELEKIKSEASF